VQPDAVCGSLHDLDEWLTGHIMVAPEASRH
jgi:hypothetical protein